MTNSNEHASTSSTDKKRGAGTAVWLLLILMIALISGAGYYFWHSTSNNFSQQQTQITGLELELAQVQSALAEQTKKLEATHQQALVIQDLAQQAMDMGNRRQKGWLLAEADYLMRIASHRLQISNDINGAIAALQSADQGLFESSDVTLLPVRQQLVKDIAALKLLHQPDVDGIVLTLDQMSDQVATLPYKSADEEVQQQTAESTTLASTLTSTPASTSVEAPKTGLSDKIMDAIKALGNIKIHRGRIKTASDEQQQYQSMHILLSHLSSARLAALRVDTKQFAYDIGIAKNILNKHYDLRDNRVAKMHKDLEKFMQVELAPPLPDISSSWTKLQVARNKIVESPK